MLQQAGLVSQGRQAQRRPCRLEPAPLQEAAGWVERYIGIYEERFGRLEEYLRELQEKEKHHGERP